MMESQEHEEIQHRIKHLSEDEITNKIGLATNVIIEYCKWYQSKHPFKEIFASGTYISEIIETEYQTARLNYIESSRTKDDSLQYASSLKLILDKNNVTYMMYNYAYPRYADGSFFN